jgi:hypothetical protein
LGTKFILKGGIDMIKSIIKVAKVALVGYLAYKAVEIVTHQNDEESQDETENVVEHVSEVVTNNNNLKIAGGIAVVYLLVRHHQLAKQVGYLQTMVAANRFNAIVTADSIGMFDGPDRLRVLDSNLKAVKNMTNNPAIRRAVKEFMQRIHLGYGGELHV